MLNFEEFSGEIANALELPDCGYDPDTLISGIADLDSLDIVLLLVVIEELAEAIPGAAEDRPLSTLGEAYEAYRALCER